MALQHRATNNQTNSRNFKTLKVEFTYSDFTCHLKVNRDKLALIKDVRAQNFPHTDFVKTLTAGRE